MNARWPVLPPAWRLWLRQMRVMTAKELRQLARDRVLLIFIIYIFTVHIIIAAGGIQTELRRAGVLVHDADHSAASRELIYRFQPPYFQLKREVTDADAALTLLDRGQAKVLLDIPAQFEKTLNEADQPAVAQMMVDTSNANSGFLASNYGTRIAAGYGQEWARRDLTNAGLDPDKLPVIRNETRVWYNPELDEAWFGTLSDLLTMMTVACILLPAAASVREKEHGTIEQLLVAPLTPFQIMASKVVAMILVMLAGTALSLFGIMQPFFGVPARGSLLLFFALTALYAFTNAGLGLITATFARSSAQVGLLIMLIVMPIVMLSGTHTPLESMPVWLQEVMRISPLRYFIVMSYGILLRGAGLNILWDSVLAMAAIGAVLFALGMWRFRRQFG
jgi:ABC-2 type transport system permease protein